MSVDPSPPNPAIIADDPSIPADGHDGASPITAPSSTHPTRHLFDQAVFTQWPLLTVEHCIYLLIGVLSLISHIWSLGERALHHDETLHAFYSWNIYTGQSYMHDPLLHGPFLYYIGAAIYFLFGDNDFTARLGVALFGTILPLLLFFIRHEIGRLAALLAAIYLLISPSFLYFGRFIRHDGYSILFELLIFIAIVRYAVTWHPRWLYTGAIAFALMLTNQETTYLFILIMGTPLLLLFLWHTFKPGILILMTFAIALAALFFILPGKAEVDGGHTARRDPNTGLMRYTPGPVFGWYPLETDDNAYALRVRNRSDADGGRPLAENFARYMGDLWLFFGHPAPLTAIGLGIATVGGMLWAIWFARGTDGHTRWQRARAEPSNPTIATFASLAFDARWLIALLLMLIIYLLFFTAFFTNLLGSITGITGSLLYWKAQHNVERGGQPHHYYLTMLLIYEPLLVIGSFAGLLMIAISFIRNALRPAASDTDTPAMSTPAIVLLLAWWSVMALGLYSWAGERMPWLIVHSVLPMTLFTAWVLQAFFRQVAPALHPSDDSGSIDNQWIRFILFSSLFFAALGFFIIQMTISIRAGVRWQWSGEPLPLITFLIITLFFIVWLTVAATAAWGWRWSLGALVICLLLASSMLTIRNAYRVTYLIGDIPREMLIYTQTSPDIVRAVRQIEEVSMRHTSGLGLPIIYDNETISQWYFRNFSERQRVSPPLQNPPSDDIQAMFLLRENIPESLSTSPYLQGFCVQNYPLRWWFPENAIYKLENNPSTDVVEWQTQPIDQVSLLARVLREPFADETIIRLWNFLIHRDPGAPLGSSDMIIAVRPAIADQVSPGMCAIRVP